MRRGCSFHGCQGRHKALGFCRSHYSQLKRKGEVGSLQVRPSREDAFWASVKRGALDECWPWEGITAGKYGRFNDGGRRVGAHQFSFKLKTGAYLPRGLEVDHRCRNKLCVNPDHLQSETSSGNKENLALTGRPGTSQYRGVSWFPRTRKWRARASSRGVVFNLGYFDTELEAANAALRKRLELLSNNIEDRKAEVLT